MRRSLTVIVKPTNQCNLSCRYCCVERDAKQGRMSSGTLERCVEQVMTLPGKDNINWIWHGGEPALMGVKFFEDAVELQRKSGGNRRVRNSIQTNATLLSDEFLDFLMANDFKITSSIDGPAIIHNRTRVYPDGRGSFDDAWRVIQEAQRRVTEKNAKGGSHTSLGLMCVLTKKNINDLDTVYDFFSANNIAVKFNPLINTGRALDNIEGLRIGEGDFGIALSKLFDRWFYEKDLGIDVKPLSNILISLLTNSPTDCQSAGSCRESFISIGPQGDVYPCGRFDGFEEYWMGNIHDRDLQELFNSRKHVEIDNGRRNAIADDCKTCTYREVCNSGCMFNAYRNGGKKDPYCASYKILFEHLGSALEKELSKIGEQYVGAS